MKAALLLLLYVFLIAAKERKINCGFGYYEYDPCSNPKNFEFTDEQKRRLIAAYYGESVSVEDATDIVEQANQIVSHYNMKTAKLDEKMKELEEMQKHYETECLPCDLHDCRFFGAKAGVIAFIVSMILFVFICMA